MKQRGKRKHSFASSSQPSSTFVSSSSPTSSVSPTRDSIVKKKKSENAENAEENTTPKTLEDMFATITMEHSEEAFLPSTCAPISWDSSDDEEEGEEEVEKPSGSQLGPLAVSTFPPEPSKSLPAGSDEEYEVERILLKRNATNYHLVKWLGYDVNEATWERSSELAKCKKIDQIFEGRKEICFQIYKSLANQRQYEGFLDIWITGIITTTFTESVLLEEIFTKVCRDNELADFVVENWTRSIESFPKFAFLVENVFSARAKHLLNNTTPQSCNCASGKCDKKECQCLKAPPKPKKTESEAVCLRECHPTCPCGPKCPGKIKMNGRKIPIMLFKTFNRGWSLYTMAPIKKNTFVMEYVGVTKLHEECQNIRDQTYLFDIDSERGKTVFVVDASVYGNASRFINHSCDPNLEVTLIKGLYSHQDYARITFFSIRDIKPGEELTFNYFKHKLDRSKVDPTTPKCHCGYDGCREYLI